MHPNHTISRLFLATLGWAGILIGLCGWVVLLAVFMGAK